MRPSNPVPRTLARSTPFSLASLRTSGEVRMSRTPIPAGAAAGAVAGGVSPRTGSSAGAVPGGGTGASGAGVPGVKTAASGEAPTRPSPAAGCPASSCASSAAPSAPSMTATTVLIWTLLPSGTRIFVRMPDAGAGISESTLSVEISNSGSSRTTGSPTFFNHLVSVPSKTDSPICGMITLVVMRQRPS